MKPAALPTGTVTFLFTDIEGSTQRWESHGDEMASAVERHDALMRGAIEAHSGVIFKTVGDAFCAVFADADDAIAAAIDAQARLAAEDFSRVQGVRVRMALHSGVAHERDRDYFGPTVNRVARLLSAGHGGQMLLSEATAQMRTDAEAASYTVRDLGRHRLKDLDRAEHVYQVDVRGLLSEFPSLRSLGEHSNNLPLQLTAFIGREREVGEIVGLLREVRIVSIVGAGGVGKTRIATQVGAQLVDGSGDGVWLVELASLNDGLLIPGAIAKELELPLSVSGDPLQSLAKAMRQMRVLLVLDNCEHLIESAAAVVAAICQTCPAVSILATSREPLGVGGETVYRLPSLPVGEAAQLFALRAHAIDPRFALTSQSGPIVEDICARLDGIPLAIELAAARVKVLSPDQLRHRLDERFKLLTGGRRDALPRQQTMRAVIDWSFDLLTEPERVLLRRLSIFAGGWTLDAAEAVCVDGTINAEQVFELQASLIEKSLLEAEIGETDQRYHMLQSTRAYAKEKLTASGESETISRLHAQWAADFARREAASMRTSSLEVPPPAVQLEFDNIRAALSWSIGDARDIGIGAHIAGTMRSLFEPFSVGECLRWIRAGVALLDESTSPEVAARLYDALGQMSSGKGKAVAARRAIELYERLGDELNVARLNTSLGFGLMQMGELTEALAATERGMDIYTARSMNRTFAYAGALINQALILQQLGRTDLARAGLADGISLYEQLGFRQNAALGRMDSAELECNCGNFEAALALSKHVIADLEAAGHLRGLCVAYENAAAYHVLLGQLDDAVVQARLSLRLGQRVQDSFKITLCLQHLAAIAALRGDVHVGARLDGYVEAAYRAAGYARESTERQTYQLLLDALLAHLSEDEIAQLGAQGEGMGEDDAVALGFAIADASVAEQADRAS